VVEDVAEKVKKLLPPTKMKIAVLKERIKASTKM
jgi:hypothetical protein